MFFFFSLFFLFFCVGVAPPSHGRRAAVGAMAAVGAAARCSRLGARELAADVGAALQLDEGANNRINRAHNLWVMSSGFVPKF